MQMPRNTNKGTFKHRVTMKPKIPAHIVLIRMRIAKTTEGMMMASAVLPFAPAPSVIITVTTAPTTVGTITPTHDLQSRGRELKVTADILKRYPSPKQSFWGLRQLPFPKVISILYAGLHVYTTG